MDDLHGRHQLLINPLLHIIPGEPAVVPHTGKDVVVFAGHLNGNDDDDKNDEILSKW